MKQANDMVQRRQLINTRTRACGAGAFPREQRTSRHRHIGGANANRGNTLPHEIEEPVLNSARAKFILNNEHSGAAVRGVGAILP